MIEVEAETFMQRLIDQGGGRRIPWSGSIELTTRCNLNCRHCFINTPVNDRKARQEELSTDEVIGVLDEVAAEGCLWLLLTGGEPFVRPDFLEIYEHAKKKGFLVIVFTNGTKITPEAARFLSQNPPFSIEVSLYGATQHVYESITRVKGSYKSCLQGIDLLMRYDMPLKLKTVLMTGNHHEFPLIKAFAEERSLEFYYDAVINSRLDGTSNRCQLRLSPEEVVTLESHDKERSEEWCRHFAQSKGAITPSPYVYQCGAGRAYFHVDSSGHLSPCLMVRHESYDLLRGTFREGWQDFMPSFLSRKMSLESKCRTCDLRVSCSQCPGLAQIETGSEEKTIEYICDMAHRRAQAFSNRPNMNKETGYGK